MVIRRPWLMIVPFVIDLFLWLGPRLLASALYTQVAPFFQNLPASIDSDTQLAIQQIGQTLQDFFSKTNLFSWLSSILYGVPVINSGLDATTPVATGLAPSLEIADFGTYLLAFIVLNIIGLLLTAVLWVLLTDALRKTPFNFFTVVQRSLTLWRKLTGLLALLTIVLLLLSLPASLLIGLLGMISLSLAALVPMLIFSLIIWGLYSIIFTLHGLVLYDLPVNRSMRLSVVVTRLYGLPFLGFVILSMAIYLGIGLLLDGIDPASWARLLSMAGNAFLVSGLFMASLIFYQSKSSVVLEYFQTMNQIVESVKIKSQSTNDK